ncbi:MAG: single-stranded-DNA-specific exonuclease RecJ [Thermoleophilia bacterium]
MSAVPLWRADRVEFDKVAAVQGALGVPEPLAWALVRRGLGDPVVAREFLAADGPLAPPEAIAGLPEAAERMLRAIDRRERIVVHGDYDCDGVVSTTLMVGALRARGADVGHVLPSRFSEGYGVAEATVDRLADEGCRLLVCVDCGTSAVDALRRAVDLGMEAIVLDHHLAGGARPPALIANPALGRPAPDLPAAAGVVHGVIRALAERSPGGVLDPEPEADLDLVALATVADAVPLVGDNRRMVVRGLERMRRAPRPGIAALCTVAGVEPRTLTARGLGFTIAPCINAAGRLAHPDRALELLMARDEETALPIARELWELNGERREVERAIVEEAIAMFEAEPPAIRSAGVIVAAGDGWHEGVVGIVASRLVERFERPAIVIARDGDRGKGSGRSLPGVDLHAMVGGACGALGRWGGHAGAIGLELPCSRIAEFREDLIRAAEGLRGVIDRARVRTVDAVAGCPDLTLETAEALDALAPFGRGNPPVRIAVPAARIESPQAVGQGKHLQVRLTAGGAHARGIGFQMGARARGLDIEARHDAVIALEVERWQGVVGPRVGLRALDPLPPGDRAWVEPCGIESAERGGLTREDVLDGPGDPAAVPAPAPPRGVRDLRGTAAAIATITALAGADRGVAVVVADLARRRSALADVIAPARTGVELVLAVDGRMSATAVDARLRTADGVSSVIALDYAALAAAPLPADIHLALLDPPTCPEHDAALRAAAAGRWLHVLWGEEDAEVAAAAARDEWRVRDAAAHVWRALGDGAERPFGAGLDRLLLGSEGPIRPPRIVARAMRALVEVGLLVVAGDTVCGRPDAGRRDLGESPTARMCADRLDAALVRCAAWQGIEVPRAGSLLVTRDIVHT